MIAALPMTAAASVFASCDGGLLVTRAAAVWSREEDGWTQLHGAVAERAPAADDPGVERASCARAPISNTPFVPRGAKRGGGSSRDRSLVWSWQVDADGARHFSARLWTGERYRIVVEDVVPAAK